MVVYKKTTKGWVDVKTGKIVAPPQQTGTGLAYKELEKKYGSPSNVHGEEEPYTYAEVTGLGSQPVKVGISKGVYEQAMATPGGFEAAALQHSSSRPLTVKQVEPAVQPIKKIVSTPIGTPADFGQAVAAWGSRATQLLPFSIGKPIYSESGKRVGIITPQEQLFPYPERKTWLGKLGAGIGMLGGPSVTIGGIVEPTIGAVGKTKFVKGQTEAISELGLIKPFETKWFKATTEVEPAIIYPGIVKGASEVSWISKVTAYGKQRITNYKGFASALEKSTKDLSPKVTPLNLLIYDVSGVSTKISKINQLFNKKTYYESLSHTEQGLKTGFGYIWEKGTAFTKTGLSKLKFDDTALELDPRKFPVQLRTEAIKQFKALNVETFTKVFEKGWDIDFPGTPSITNIFQDRIIGISKKVTPRTISIQLRETQPVLEKAYSSYQARANQLSQLQSVEESKNVLKAISFSIAGLRTETQEPVLKYRTSVETRQRISPILETLQKPIPPIIEEIGEITIPKSALDTRQDLVPKITMPEITIPRLITQPRFNITIPRIPPPTFPILFPLFKPSFNYRERSGRTGRKRLKARTKYQPSLAGILKDIKITKIPKELTGIEVRGIYVPTRRKKRRK